VKKIDKLVAKREELQAHSFETVERLSQLDVEISKAEAELAEAKKPELKDGDFGLKHGDPWIKIKDKIWWVGKKSQKNPSSLGEGTFADSIGGNLEQVFDELKALQEPLEQGSHFFECSKDGEDKLEVYLSEYNTLMLSQNNAPTRILLSPESLRKYIITLQRAEATTKAKAK